MEAVDLHTVLILLATAVVLVVLFRYLHLPPILAYLAAGVLIGPHGFVWVPDVAASRTLAEFGLVFLMFTIGLEFSLPRLMAMKKMVFGLGGTQVLVSALGFGLAAWLLGAGGEGAIVLGGMLAMSSTAIVAKLLVERLEHNSRHGNASLGVLLFQDLAVVPFLILIPALAGVGGGSVWATLGTVLLKSAALLVGILAAGHWLLRPLFHEIARARNRELFMFVVLLLVLAAAWASELAGLSLALGAFFAGMMIGETEYRHQVEGDILPFRDILLGFFFITVGMLLDLDVVARHWLWIVLGLAGLLAFKTLVVAYAGRIFGLLPGSALRAGLVLSAGGEFAFALLLTARQYKLLDGELAQGVLAVVILSMVAAPLLIHYSGRIAKRVVPSYGRARSSDLESIRIEAASARGHVIICGYGRSGQNLAFMLEQEYVPSLALDLDPVRVRDARDAGKPVVYGDAARRDVLEAAGLAHAAALAVSFNDFGETQKILEVTRHLRPDMPVIVRTMDDARLEELQTAGATEVVPESLEGSLMMGSHLLLLLGVPVSRIVRHVRDVRRNRYRMLRGFFHGGFEYAEDAAHAYQERLHSIALPERAAAVGKRLAELGLEQLGVEVNTVRRGGIRGPQPSPETTLIAGDVLVLYGTPEALAEAEKVLLQG